MLKDRLEYTKAKRRMARLQRDYDYYRKRELNTGCDHCEDNYRQYWKEAEYEIKRLKPLIAEYEVLAQLKSNC